MVSVPHREGRVLSFFSSRRIWDSPNLSTAGEYAPPSASGGRGKLAMAREGLGESQFRRGDIHCVTLYIYVLCAFPHPIFTASIDTEITFFPSPPPFPSCIEITLQWGANEKSWREWGLDANPRTKIGNPHLKGTVSRESSGKVSKYVIRMPKVQENWVYLNEKSS
jgi:hypothetical protein